MSSTQSERLHDNSEGQLSSINYSENGTVYRLRQRQRRAGKQIMKKLNEDAMIQQLQSSRFRLLLFVKNIIQQEKSLRIQVKIIKSQLKEMQSRFQAFQKQYYMEKRIQQKRRIKIMLQKKNENKNKRSVNIYGISIAIALFCFTKLILKQ